MKLISKLAVSAGIAGIAALAIVAPANAATLAPQEMDANTLAPGSTGKVGAVIWNQVGAEQSGDITLYLKAPDHATFAGDRLWSTQIVEGEAAATDTQVLSCQRGADLTTMTCTGSLTIPAAGNGHLSGLRLTANMNIDAGAPADTLFNNGDFNLTNGGDISGGRVGLQYRTPAVADTPIIAPIMAAGAGFVAVGIAGGMALYRRKTA